MNRQRNNSNKNPITITTRTRTTTSEAEHVILSKGLDRLSIQDVENVSSRLSETVIATHLNQLSMQQRDAVLQDIHGVADIIVETPALISSSLLELERELNAFVLQLQSNRSNNNNSNNINNTNGMNHDDQSLAAASSTTSMNNNVNNHNSLHPYEIVLSHQRSTSSTTTDSNIINNNKTIGLRLSFLRAEQFHPQKAAQRLLRYYEEKQRLFGTTLLNKHQIHISDLDCEAKQHLHCGRMQLLQERDRAGRAVLVGVKKLQCEIHNEDSLVRAYYLFMSFCCLLMDD